MRIIKNKRGYRPLFCAVLHTVIGACMAVNVCAIEDKAATNQAGLAATLQAVMHYNPSVKGKQSEINAQSFAVDSAKAGRYPTFSGQANNVGDHVNQGSLRLQQPLWAFGKIDSAIDQAKAQFNAEQWALLQVQRQLIEEASATYAKVEGIHQRKEIAQKNIAEHTRLYQRIERRFNGKLASQADVRLAYSRLIQARANLQRIHGEWQIAIADLQALTQVPVSSDVPVSPNLVELPSLAEVETIAVEHSADVAFKQQRLQVAQQTVRKEKNSSLPTIYFRVEQDILDTPQGADDTRMGLVIESSLDGLGFAALGRVKGASAQLDAARYDVTQTRIETKRRIKSLMLNRQVQQTLSTSQHEAVTAVEETMASFLRQYDSGRKSWVEVLNTQRELTELRFQLAQIKTDWLVLSLRISAVIGHLDILAGIEQP